MGEWRSSDVGFTLISSVNISSGGRSVIVRVVPLLCQIKETCSIASMHCSVSLVYFGPLRIRSSSFLMSSTLRSQVLIEGGMPFFHKRGLQDLSAFLFQLFKG